MGLHLKNRLKDVPPPTKLTQCARFVKAQQDCERWNGSLHTGRYDRRLDPIGLFEFCDLQRLLENTVLHKSHQHVLLDQTSLPSDNVVGLQSSAPVGYAVDRPRYRYLPTR